MKKTKEKPDCISCYGKGYYTQIFGIQHMADFSADEAYEEKPAIHKIACPTCNPRNKRRLKGVMKTVFD